MDIMYKDTNMDIMYKDTISAQIHGEEWKIK